VSAAADGEVKKQIPFQPGIFFSFISVVLSGKDDNYFLKKLH